MKRIIYSIFIQIPNDDLDWQPPYPGETESKNDKANRVFRENHEWLTAMQKGYADALKVEYRQYTRDEEYLKFEKWYRDNHPDVTVWNIVNFYKIHLMYKLIEEFDEVLYLDIDVVPISNLNFFNYNSLARDAGIPIFKNDPKVSLSLASIKKESDWRQKIDKSAHSVRSPAAKYWNAAALLLDEGYPPENWVYNTGIVSANKKYLDKLAYFEDHTYWLNTMSELRNEEDSMYPLWIQEMFGWDNETLWSVKSKINNVDSIWLPSTWHHFMDNECYIPKDTNLIHVINKEFDWVRKWCDENNIQPVRKVN